MVSAIIHEIIVFSFITLTYVRNRGEKFERN